MPSTERTGTTPTPPGTAPPGTTPTPPGTAPPAPGTAPAAGDGAGRPHRVPNGYATAALVLGATGFTLVTVVPAVVYSILGLRRARARGAGSVRCWLGIGLAVAWAAAGGFGVPRLVQASDPGCTAYKGPALTAYDKVIDGFGGRSPRTVAPDVSQTITALDAAAARSHSRPAARDLSHLAAELTIVLTDARAGRAVPDSVLSALNRAAAAADADCGTVRF